MFEEYTKQKIKKLLIPKSAFHPYPAIGERGAWEGLPQELKKKLIKNADLFLDKPIVPLRASLFMQYHRTGSRSEYEDLYFQRRKALTALVLGECVQDNGVYLTQIIDLIWAVCEESTWAVPSHNYVFNNNADVNVGSLVDVDRPIFDLFAGETASLMAFIYEILKERLFEVSPYIPQRMLREIRKRIVEPYIECDGYLWMLFKKYDNVLINNWTPWNTSNAVFAGLLTAEKEEERAWIMEKALRSLDLFLATYPEDGGCDEGPGYWYKAAGSVFDILDFMKKATGGKMDLFKGNQLIARMGAYICEMHIYGNHFVCYADGQETCGFLPQKVFRFGEETGNEQMKAMAKELFLNAEKAFGLYDNLYDGLLGAFYYSTLDAYQTQGLIKKDTWLKDLNIACIRRADWFISAKGGHNNESHNHNDVGNFVIYYQNTPVIVDMGVGKYTKQHWGDSRYTLVTNRSMYHNLPVINGAEEAAGAQYRAAGMEYNAEESRITIDVKDAYPKEAGLKQFLREIRTADGVQVEDIIETEEASLISHHLITPCRPETETEGTLLLGKVRLIYDSQSLQMTYEKIPLDDKLAGVWKEGLYRLCFEAADKKERTVNRFRLIPR